MKRRPKIDADLTILLRKREPLRRSGGVNIQQLSTKRDNDSIYHKKKV